MKTILIADDEPHVSRVLHQFLERAGYNVTTVMNGHQALLHIREHKPDVLITDVQMPVMNGLELCQNLVIEGLNDIRLIIVMTSRTDSQIRTWAELTQIELMEKPLSMRRLLARLNEFFESER